MPIVFPHPAREVWHLVPFILPALSLHLALLFFLHLPVRTTAVVSPHPLMVVFAAPHVTERPQDSSQHIPEKKLRHAIGMAAGEPVRPETMPSPDAPVSALLESAHSIARDEARKVEQGYAALEKKKLTTPAVSLDRYLHQPHKEIRLANGTLKIITDAGEICFQSVPYFAKDSAGVFGIPSTCP